MKLITPTRRRQAGKNHCALSGPGMVAAWMLFFLFCPLVLCLEAADDRDMFTLLQQQLVKDGFDPERIDDYFSRPEVRFEADTVNRYFQHSEARLNYEQFLTAASLDNARKYMKTHRRWLQKARAAYGVEKEIIAAIILVETRFGRVLGNAVTFNTLASMAALSDPDRREGFRRTTAADSRLTDEAFRQRATQKAGWAYRELKAFLTYVERENISNPLAIKGSYAGAVGIPQFMPSNILTLGVDGNSDGKIDLFSHADAILSVARYLEHHGWKTDFPEESETDAARVLRRYNNSRYYVDTLLRIRQQLKG